MGWSGHGQESQSPMKRKTTRLCLRQTRIAGTNLPSTPISATKTHAGCGTKDSLRLAGRSDPYRRVPRSEWRARHWSERARARIVGIAVYSAGLAHHVDKFSRGVKRHRERILACPKRSGGDWSKDSSRGVDLITNNVVFESVGNVQECS